MGLLDFIFGKSVKIENSFFGSMLFLDFKGEVDNSYFECRRMFAPSNDIIEIGIDGDISGPTQKQIDFFKTIEEQYQEISSSIKPLIEDQFQNWKEDFEIVDFKKEFKPVYLRMPKCEEMPIVWEIAFESHHDRNHTFTLTMENLIAKELLIDG
jgi:hypothetical protein